MALKTEEKERLANTSVPSESETREMVRRFLDQSGFTQEDLAEALHYSRSALGLFLLDRYNDRVHQNDSNTLKLRATIKEFIESHPQAQAAVDSTETLDTSDYRAVRRVFLKAADDSLQERARRRHGLAYCVNGDPGTGKTFSLKKLCEEVRAADASKNGSGRRVIYVRARWNMGPMDLLRRVADAAGISHRGQIDQLLRKLRFVLSTRRVLIVIDEAQLCSLGCLETVRELLDEPPYFGLIFAGSHDVEHKFQQIQMEQWRRRLNKAITLEGLSREEAEGLIEQSLGSLGRIPRKLVDFLIAKATTFSVRRTDPATRKPIEYISAGNLANAIAEAKQEVAGRKAVSA